MTLSHWAVRALAAALLCPTIARAQDVPPLAAGTRVQAIIPLSGDPAQPSRCEARVVQAVGDTLLLSRAGTCPPGTYSGAVRVLRADHGSRWKHLGLGFAGGAVIGGILGRLAAGDGCVGEPCDDGGLAIGLMTIGGTVIGAATGLLVGAVIPAGREWGPAQAERVLRVGGVTLRPGIRLSLRARR